MEKMDVNEIEKIEKPYILDVREKFELLETGTIKGAHHIPMIQVFESLNKIPKDKKIYVLCRSGRRSEAVCQELSELGYDTVNLEGGIINYKGKLEK